MYIGEFVPLQIACLFSSQMDQKKFLNYYWQGFGGLLLWIWKDHPAWEKN
jgi:hypothetical protein